MNSAVVLLIFNRPDLTSRVFDAVRAARPPKLLVVADGPRSDRPSDVAACAETRAIIDRVDWPCEVLKNESETNLGLRARVSSGLNWAFAQVEEAVVLEDDCLPHPSFFHYCDTLLDRYRTDERVMAVSGDNYQHGATRGTASYYFSKYITCWGWASWRRGWDKFDLQMTSWPGFRDDGGLRAVCPDPVEHDYWHAIFEAMHAGRVNSWAYAWLYAGFANGGLSPHPNVNLVSNIGFRTDGTHTVADDPCANLPVADLGDMVHPETIAADAAADRAEFDFAHGGTRRRWERTAFGRIATLPRRAAAAGLGWLRGHAS